MKYRLERRMPDGSIRELNRFATLKEALAMLDLLVDDWGIPASELSVTPLRS